MIVAILASIQVSVNIHISLHSSHKVVSVEAIILLFKLYNKNKSILSCKHSIVSAHWYRNIDSEISIVCE